MRRALRVDLGSRYQTAAHLRRDLELYLATRTSMSHSALMVAFLRSRGKLTETEARERLSPRELKVADTFERQARKKKKRHPLRWLFAFAAAAGTGLYFTQQHWLPLLDKLPR